MCYDGFHRQRVSTVKIGCRSCPGARQSSRGFSLMPRPCRAERGGVPGDPTIPTTGCVSYEPDAPPAFKSAGRFSARHAVESRQKRACFADVLCCALRCASGLSPAGICPRRANIRTSLARFCVGPWATGTKSRNQAVMLSSEGCRVGGRRLAITARPATRRRFWANRRCARFCPGAGDGPAPALG